MTRRELLSAGDAGERLNDLFGPPISVYTREQAVEECRELYGDEDDWTAAIL